MMCKTTAKISLAGDLGSGKSTVADILKARLGAEYYSTGAICRRIAAEHGMDVVQMNQYMETHPEFDKLIDDGLIALSNVDKDMIIDSRMAWHFVKDTFRVYMTTEHTESARRILSAGRAEEKVTSLEECAEKIRQRKQSENKRYFEKYGVHCQDLDNYSLIVDTTYASPEEVAECILSCFADWHEDHRRTYAYICPRRFLYPDDAADMARVGKLSSLLEEGVDIGSAGAVEANGDIYLTSDVEVAMAFELCGMPLVPTKLTVADQKPVGQFVHMADSL